MMAVLHSEEAAPVTHGTAGSQGSAGVAQLPSAAGPATAPAPHIRFNKPGGSGPAGPSQAAMMQELEKLHQIKQKGMRSEQLEKGNKRMYKTDISNLQFMLKVLGLISFGTASGEIDSQTSMMDKSLISNSTERAGHYDSRTKTSVKRF